MANDGAVVWLSKPPKQSGWSRIQPMTRRAALAWLASYDVWVEKWNRHEADPTLKHSPEWPDADFIFGGWPRSSVAFVPIGVTPEQAGVIRMRDFHPFHPGWSFKRHLSRPDDILWGGWFVFGSARGGSHDITEPLPLRASL